MKKECENLGPRLSAYLDGELSEEEQEKVKRHLETCYVCRQLISEPEETGGILKTALSPGPEPEVDLTGVWEEIQERAHFGPTIWQRIKKLFWKPSVWLPVSVATAAAVLLVFMFPMKRAQAPMELSRVESVYSRTGQVMLLQTAKSGQPLIWILPEAKKEVSS